VPRLPSLLVDAALVLLFALMGRVSHDEGLTLTGLLQTAWPFIVGLLMGWLAVRAVRHRWPREVLDAVPVWVVTVVGGLCLRVLSGTGEAPWSFAAVATVVLGAFLLGWRSVAAIVLFAVEGLDRWNRSQERTRAGR
jgi:Protein of unknown function (DUF3054)